MSDPRYRILPDDENERLTKRYPSLAKGYEKWCPTCDKKGVYTAPDGMLTECDCEQQVALFKHYAAAGIGATYMRLNWPDYVGDQGIVGGLSKYLANLPEFTRRGIGLYFSGSYGTGKTMLANLMLKEVVKRGHTAFATTFAQTVEMYTAGWGDRDEKAWFQRKFLSSQFLLLDDVGRELRGTKLALSETTFDSILRQRVTDGRPTYLTTNMTAEDLEQGYGSAVLSLIKEKSLEEVFSGSDFRGKANDRELSEVMKGVTRAIV